jgi:hypothetical protein
MATFAVIENDIVVNLIVADTLAIAEEVTDCKCVEYEGINTFQVGWGYDGKKFTEPVPVEEPTDPVK